MFKVRTYNAISPLGLNRFPKEDIEKAIKQLERVGIAPLVFYWSGEVARMLLLSPLAIADRPGVLRMWREHRWRVLGIAVLSPLSYILILIAFQHGNVSHIAPARELSILIGAYLGARVLGEGERWRRMAAAAAFAAGVILLALA